MLRGFQICRFVFIRVIALANINWCVASWGTIYIWRATFVLRWTCADLATPISFLALPATIIICLHIFVAKSTPRTFVPRTFVAIISFFARHFFELCNLSVGPMKIFWGHTIRYVEALLFDGIISQFEQTFLSCRLKAFTCSSIRRAFCLGPTVQAFQVRRNWFVRPFLTRHALSFLTGS